MYAIAIIKCQMQESLLLMSANITTKQRIKIKHYFIWESCKKKRHRFYQYLPTRPYRT